MAASKQLTPSLRASIKQARPTLSYLEPRDICEFPEKRGPNIDPKIVGDQAEQKSAAEVCVPQDLHAISRHGTGVKRKLLLVEERHLSAGVRGRISSSRCLQL